MFPISKAEVDRVVNRQMGRVRMLANSKIALLPLALQDKDFKVGTWITDSFVLIFVSDVGRMSRFNKRVRDGRAPFPGLLTTNADMPCGIRLDDSRFISITHCAFKNTICFGLGKGASAVLERISFEFTGIEGADKFQEVPLAYLVSTGSGISTITVPQELENLIVFSFSSHRVY